jgi:glucose/arabinose dehydrogenase
VTDDTDASGRDSSSCSRRQLLAAGATALAGLAGCAGRAPAERSGGGADGTTGSDSTDSDRSSTTGSPSDDVPPIEAERLASGFTSPVSVAAPEGTDRLLVVDQPGTVYLVPPDGGDASVYLDVTDRVVDVRGGYDERGLLGLAPHPDFADNGRLYLRYSAPRREGTPSGFSHTFVLSEVTVDPTADRVSPATERTLLEIPQPQANHNAGDLAFGPDGFLYVGVGDGGGSNDVGTGHVDDWYGGNAGGNGQDVTGNLLGSVLRLDVDATGGADGDDDRPYGVPSDNPLVGRAGLGEQYAWGFRNPWRFSFDRPSGRFLVADVGQNRREEVNDVVAGGNYGWNVREGGDCFSTSSPGDPPTDCPTVTSDGQRLRDPVISYPHGGGPVSGIAVVGGYVVRDGVLPGYDGQYIFADWRAEGSLFVATPTGDTGWPTRSVSLSGDIGQFLPSFGRDQDGELYVLSTNRGGVTGSTGALHRLETG